MRELIYKDEAYKAIDNCIRDGWYRISPSEAKMNIHHLVSDANEADRPQGEWINKGAVCQCTRCKGYSRGLLEEKNGKLCEPYKLIYPRFCPNCGVRMKGADDE